MVPSVNTTQIPRALGRLTQMYRNQPNCQNILKSLLVGVPELENLFWQIINQRILSTLTTMVAAHQNTADQLDLIGALVGEDRMGRSDAEYLPVIKLRIRVNRSQGRSEDILAVMRLTGFDFSYSESDTGIAAWRVDVYSVPNANAYGPLLSKTRSAGTRGYFRYTDLARAPVDFGGIRFAAPLIWGETLWADTVGGTDLTTWPSLEIT